MVLLTDGPAVVPILENEFQPMQSHIKSVILRLASFPDPEKQPTSEERFGSHSKDPRNSDGRIVVDG